MYIYIYIYIYVYIYIYIYYKQIVVIFSIPQFNIIVVSNLYIVKYLIIYN